MGRKGATKTRLKIGKKTIKNKKKYSTIWAVATTKVKKAKKACNMYKVKHLENQQNQQRETELRAEEGVEVRERQALPGRGIQQVPLRQAAFSAFPQGSLQLALKPFDRFHSDQLRREPVVAVY